MHGSDAPKAERLEAWLRTQPGFAEAEVATVAPLTEGYSNLTSRVGLHGAPVADVVLREQPASGIFEPYDVLREATVLRCLADTVVPVPAVLGSEAAVDVLGTPFFVMEWIDAPHLGAAFEARLFERFFEAVVGVHSVDWEAAGLGALGAPTGAAAALHADVELVARRMADRGIDDARLVEACERLRDVAVDGGRLALCQGDVNVFNYLVRDGDVVGVVDWEQAHVADPRTDLGQLQALQLLTGTTSFGPADGDLTTTMYEAAGGGRVAGMEPFRAYWLLQLGFIHHAYLAERGEPPWYSGEQVHDLLGRSLALL